MNFLSRFPFMIFPFATTFSHFTNFHLCTSLKQVSPGNCATTRLASSQILELLAFLSTSAITAQKGLEGQFPPFLTTSVPIYRIQDGYL